MQNASTISVVIEWENTRNSENARAFQMMRALITQLEAARHRMAGPTEIILVHDASESVAHDVLASLQNEVASFSGTIRAIAAHGLDYYQQKTLGASHATGNTILFVDSDVIPAPRWFETLLDCYEQERADVVGGATHLATDTLYAKTFALFWFFPLPRDATERRRTDHFFANNVMFRASVFKEMPFRGDSSLVRGTCCELAGELAARQKAIFTEPRAFVSHPPPNGLKHFVNRALCQGHDNVFIEERGGFLRAVKRYAGGVGRASWTIVHRRGEVGLSTAGALAGIAIAGAYHSIEFVGELFTLASGPERHLIRTHCRV